MLRRENVIGRHELKKTDNSKVLQFGKVLLDSKSPTLVDVAAFISNFNLNLAGTADVDIFESQVDLLAGKSQGVLLSSDYGRQNIPVCILKGLLGQLSSFAIKEQYPTFGTKRSLNVTVGTYAFGSHDILKKVVSDILSKGPKDGSECHKLSDREENLLRALLKYHPDCDSKLADCKAIKVGVRTIPLRGTVRSFFIEHSDAKKNEDTPFSYVKCLNNVADPLFDPIIKFLVDQVVKILTVYPNIVSRSAILTMAEQSRPPPFSKSKNASLAFCKGLLRIATELIARSLSPESTSSVISTPGFVLDQSQPHSINNLILGVAFVEASWLFLLSLDLAVDEQTKDPDTISAEDPLFLDWKTAKLTEIATLAKDAKNQSALEAAKNYLANPNLLLEEYKKGRNEETSHPSLYTLDICLSAFCTWLLSVHCAWSRMKLSVSEVASIFSSESVAICASLLNLQRITEEEWQLVNTNNNNDEHEHPYDDNISASTSRRGSTVCPTIAPSRREKIKERDYDDGCSFISKRSSVVSPHFNFDFDDETESDNGTSVDKQKCQIDESKGEVRNACFGDCMILYFTQLFASSVFLSGESHYAPHLIIHWASLSPCLYSQLILRTFKSLFQSEDFRSIQFKFNCMKYMASFIARVKGIPRNTILSTCMEWIRMAEQAVANPNSSHPNWSPSLTLVLNCIFLVLNSRLYLWDPSCTEFTKSNSNFASDTNSPIPLSEFSPADYHSEDLSVSSESLKQMSTALYRLSCLLIKCVKLGHVVSGQPTGTSFVATLRLFIGKKNVDSPLKQICDDIRSCITTSRTPNTNEKWPLDPVAALTMSRRFISHQERTVTSYDFALIRKSKTKKGIFDPFISTLLMNPPIPHFDHVDNSENLKSSSVSVPLSPVAELTQIATQVTEKDENDFLPVPKQSEPVEIKEKIESVTERNSIVEPQETDSSETEKVVDMDKVKLADKEAEEKLGQSDSESEGTESVSGEETKKGVDPQGDLISNSNKGVGNGSDNNSDVYSKQDSMRETASDKSSPICELEQNWDSPDALNEDSASETSMQNDTQSVTSEKPLEDSETDDSETDDSETEGNSKTIPLKSNRAYSKDSNPDAKLFPSAMVEERKNEDVAATQEVFSEELKPHDANGGYSIFYHPEKSSPEGPSTETKIQDSANEKIKTVDNPDSHNSKSDKLLRRKSIGEVHEDQTCHSGDEEGKKITNSTVNELLPNTSTSVFVHSNPNVSPNSVSSLPPLIKPSPLLISSRNSPLDDQLVLPESNFGPIVDSSTDFCPPYNGTAVLGSVRRLVQGMNCLLGLDSRSTAGLSSSVSENDSQLKSSERQNHPHDKSLSNQPSCCSDEHLNLQKDVVNLGMQKMRLMHDIVMMKSEYLKWKMEEDKIRTRVRKLIDDCFDLTISLPPRESVQLDNRQDSTEQDYWNQICRKSENAKKALRQEDIIQQDNAQQDHSSQQDSCYEESLGERRRVNDLDRHIGSYGVNQRAFPSVINDLHSENAREEPSEWNLSYDVFGLREDHFDTNLKQTEGEMMKDIVFSQIENRCEINSGTISNRAAHEDSSSACDNREEHVETEDNPKCFPVDSISPDVNELSKIEPSCLDGLSEISKETENDERPFANEDDQFIVKMSSGEIIPAETTSSSSSKKKRKSSSDHKHSKKRKEKNTKTENRDQTEDGFQNSEKDKNRKHKEKIVEGDLHQTQDEDKRQDVDDKRQTKVHKKERKHKQKTAEKSTSEDISNTVDQLDLSQTDNVGETADKIMTGELIGDQNVKKSKKKHKHQREGSDCVEDKDKAEVEGRCEPTSKDKRKHRHKKDGKHNDKVEDKDRAEDKDKVEDRNKLEDKAARKVKKKDKQPKEGRDKAADRVEDKENTRDKSKTNGRSEKRQKKHKRSHEDKEAISNADNNELIFGRFVGSSDSNISNLVSQNLQLSQKSSADDSETLSKESSSLGKEKSTGSEKRQKAIKRKQDAECGKKKHKSSKKRKTEDSNENVADDQNKNRDPKSSLVDRQGSSSATDILNSLLYGAVL